MYILIPATLAALVAIAITVAIERFGGKVGGLLGTLPTTIVPSSLGMASNDPEIFRQALSLAPAGMLLNALFLWLWRVLPDRLPRTSLPVQLGSMVVLTLSAWLLGATLATTATHALIEQGLPPEAVGIAATVLTLSIGIVACLSTQPSPKGQRPVGPLALLARGGLAGVAIGGALWIAKSGYGVIAGVASTFPAIFLTAMVSVWWSQGRAVSGGAVGPMMLGSASVSAYALAAVLSFPALGPVGGAVLAWLVAVLCVTLPAYFWLQRRAPQSALPARPDSG